MTKYLWRTVGMLGALVAILENSVIQTALACLIIIPFHFLTVNNPSLSEIPLIIGFIFGATTVVGFGEGFYYGTFAAAADAAEDAIEEE
jgi:hypothetical protein